MMKKLITILCSLLLVLGSVAQAARVWVSGTTGDWSVGSNWTKGVVPTSSDEAQINNGTVTVDRDDATCYRIKIGCDSGTDATMVWNTLDAKLTVSKIGLDTQAVNLGYNGQGTINQSAGTLKTYGQVRLGVNDGSYGVYNLSGGLLDTLVLYKNRGEFNATGGTLAIEDSGSIRGFGLASAGGGFDQGGCLLAPGGVGTIGSISMGKLDSGGAMDYLMDSTSKVEFELGNGDPDPALSVNDKITNWGNFTIDNELLVSLTGDYQVGDKWNVWTIASGYEATYSGSGAFDTIPANIQVNWLSGSGNHTLQLEYVPEPATICLLGLGGLALLRRKRGYGA